MSTVGISSTKPPANEQDLTVRSLYLNTIHREYPDFKPRNDNDIVSLASLAYRGPPEGIYHWLDSLFEGVLQRYPNREQGITTLRENATNILALPMSGATGVKPQPGDQNALVQRIPDSEYSIRLWPGAAARREYCLDFIHFDTGQPTNTPPGFTIWYLPSETVPWSIPIQIQSLEAAFGISREELRKGEEKYILKDGGAHLLKRPGKRDVYFTVPARPLEIEIDADVVIFH